MISSSSAGLQPRPVGAFGVVITVSAAPKSQSLPRRRSPTPGRVKSIWSGTAFLWAPWIAASAG